MPKNNLVEPSVFSALTTAISVTKLNELNNALIRLEGLAKNVNNCDCEPTNCCQTLTCQADACQKCQACEECQKCQVITCQRMSCQYYSCEEFICESCQICQECETCELCQSCQSCELCERCELVIR